MQLIVAAHPDRRHGGQHHRSVSSLLVAVLTGALRLFAALLIEVVDIMAHHGPRPSTTTSTQRHPKAPPASEDPVQTAHRRDLTAKQARGPHLRATLRLAVTTTRGADASREDRAAAVAGLVNSYDHATYSWWTVSAARLAAELTGTGPHRSAARRGPGGSAGVTRPGGGGARQYS